MLAGVAQTAAGQPAAGAEVCLPSASRCSSVDLQGAFRIGDLRPGVYAIQVRTPGQPPFEAAEIEIRAGLESRVEIALPDLGAAQQSVTVSASVFVAPEEVKNSGYLITPQEIYKTAGALQDVSRYVQTRPGVVIGSDDFRNDIIVRGGSPLENLFIVDNIEIPNINTFANFASAGGTVSILDAAMIQDVTFLTGGYPSPFINRASSVLQIAQREGSRDGIGGRATLGFAGAGAILEGPLGKAQKGSWIASVRRSFLDLVTDDIGIGGVPVLYTFNAKAVYDLSPRDRVWGVNLTGIDRIRLGLNEQSDLTEEIANFDIRNRGWRSATGFNWQRLLGDRGVGLLGLTHSEAKVGTNVRDLARFRVPPSEGSPADIIAASPEVYRDNSREGESTVKYDLTTYAGAFGKVQTGGSFKIFRLRYDTAAPFGSNSPYTLETDLNPFTLDRRFHAYQSGAYAQATRDLTRRLNLTFGGRADSYEFIGRTRFSPRAGISYRITDRLSWRASYGRYFQQPFFLFLSAFEQNRGLIPFRADHYVTGFSFTPSSTLRVTLEGYRKVYADYPVASQFPQLSLANIGDTFRVIDTLFPMVSGGRGRAQGVELFIEKKFSEKWFGQMNLAFSRTRHAGLDGVLRPGSFDYPRVFNAVGGYRLRPKWEVSARLAYLSGRPFTPFDVTNSTAQRRGIFELGRVNAERLPDYFRADFRIDRTFTFRDKPLLVFAGIQNVINRRNVAGYQWNRRLNVQQTNEQLGIFPLIGLDWRF
jgi:hypothetical protein